MNNKPLLETCLSPALLHLFDTKNTIVIIIDIFRATSTITTALYNGAEKVIPIASVQDCINAKIENEAYVTAGERDGKVAPGLEYGNSPFEYPESFIKDKTLVLTTTNGTKLLHMVQDADQIVIGSFLNLEILCNYLISQNKKVLLGCAGWKDRVNMEDTLFAGAVAHYLRGHFDILCDSTRMAEELYDKSQEQGTLIDFVKDSNHYRRLSGFGLLKDMEYCLTPNLHPIVPIYDGKCLKELK